MLMPLQTQLILNSSSSGTLATGIFFTKDQTRELTTDARELITRKNQYWYKQ